jgi:hypothetical protein
VRRRLVSLTAAVALAVPPTTVAITTIGAARPAGAVSTSADWTVSTSGWNRSSSPTIADVDGDAVPEVVIGHQDGRLRVLNGATGGNLAGWPQNANSTGSGATAIDSSPAVADLFKNGQKKIVVGLGSTWRKNQHGGVVVFNANGSVHCRFRTRDLFNVWGPGGPDGYREGVFSSPAIGDVSGDGYPDIVFGAWDLRIYAIDRNCNPIIDYYVEDTVWSSPALYDADADGRLEIFIGGDQYAGGFIDHSGGEFRALTFAPGYPGNARELWKRQVNDTVWSSPALGDVNGDGRVEVVVGAGFYYDRSDSRRVFAWHAHDGSTVPGWPVTTGGWTMPSPALGDLTGDGIPEVAVAGADGYVRAYRGSGALLWARRLLFNNSSPGGQVASPIVADMNGDGQNDVGAANDWGFHVLNGNNGSLQAQVNTWMSSEAAAAVGNFGAAGWKLVVNAFNTPLKTNRLQAFDMPAPGKAPPWPMYRRDPSHKAGPVGKSLLPPGNCRKSRNPAPNPTAASSRGYWVATANGSVYALKGAPYYGGAAGRVRGRIVGIAATRSGNGYYMIDSAGQIFTFGDARSYGSMAGKPLNAPIIALAPTPSGKGYYLLGRDGGVFTFGDARFRGSLGSVRLNAPIISMTVTRTGRGYWLLGSDGGVFTFGDAVFKGSTGGMRLAAPVISMAAAPSGKGYWLVAKDGGVFSFGVPFYGSLPGAGLCRPPTGIQIRPTLTGAGYFVLATNGTVWPFGDAQAGRSAVLAVFDVATDMAVRP